MIMTKSATGMHDTPPRKFTLAQMHKLVNKFSR